MRTVPPKLVRMFRIGSSCCNVLRSTAHLQQRGAKRVALNKSLTYVVTRTLAKVSANANSLSLPTALEQTKRPGNQSAPKIRLVRTSASGIDLGRANVQELAGANDLDHPTLHCLRDLAREVRSKPTVERQRRAKSVAGVAENGLRR